NVQWPPHGSGWPGFFPGRKARPGLARQSRALKGPKERTRMSYVVTQPCHDCKYTDCVTVCPVECFYQDEMMLYIDPQDCIDCGGCVPVCPVEAIFFEQQVPARWQSYITLNAERTAVLKHNGGHITEQQEPKEGPGCKKAQ